jgi:hypothetical protein
LAPQSPSIASRKTSKTGKYALSVLHGRKLICFVWITRFRTNHAGGSIGNYFHNYPHLGLDVMYDALHAATKIVLKTNALGYVLHIS